MRRKSLEELMPALTILALGGEVVEAYGAIVEACGISRRLVFDRLIAAIAIVHGLTLVTINGDDFRDISNLRLEVWPAAQ